MPLIERVKAIIASGLALAATPDAISWKTPRPTSRLAADQTASGALPPTTSPSPPPIPPPLLTPPPLTPPLSTPPPPPSGSMAQTPPAAPMSRELVVFASGFALAAAAAVGAWLLLGADSRPLSGSPRSRPAPTQAAALASPQQADCAMEPATAAASARDGRFPLQASVAGLIEADIASFVVIGHDSAAAGRPRDAEAAFLMSCRVADKLKGAGSAEVADAKYQLGAHYAALAASGTIVAGPQRAELLGRAERLYADSSQIYAASYGQAHEKSQRVAHGRATLTQAPATPSTSAPIALSASAPAFGPATASVQAPPAVLGEPAPRLSPMPPATRVEAPASPTRAALPAAGTAPTARALPPTAAEAKDRTRQRPPALGECLPAVAALGLCDPGT